MKKRITEYLAYIDALLEKEDVDWEHEKEKHLVQIAFFAHERQVHLIVMALFALATVISILYLNFSGSLIIVALVFALLVLLIPYVMHYYLLENSVQKMYEQYDRMMNKIEPSFQVKPDDKNKTRFRLRYENYTTGGTFFFVIIAYSDFHLRHLPRRPQHP